MRAVPRDGTCARRVRRSAGCLASLRAFLVARVAHSAHEDVPSVLASLVSLQEWLREAEIKHCRVAMLALVGFIFTDFYTLPGFEYTTLEAHDACVASGSMSQLLLWIGLLEVIGFIGIDQTLRGSGREPGDFGFDPVGFASDPKKKADLQMKELANGRLAMFAFSGVVTQSVLTGNSFPYLFGDATTFGSVRAPHQITTRTRRRVSRHPRLRRSPAHALLRRVAWSPSIRRAATSRGTSWPVSNRTPFSDRCEYSSPEILGGQRQGSIRPAAHHGRDRGEDLSERGGCVLFCGPAVGRRDQCVERSCGHTVYTPAAV